MDDSRKKTYTFPLAITTIAYITAKVCDTLMLPPNMLQKGLTWKIRSVVLLLPFIKALGWCSCGPGERRKRGARLSENLSVAGSSNVNNGEQTANMWLLCSVLIGGTFFWRLNKWKLIRSIWFLSLSLDASQRYGKRSDVCFCLQETLKLDQAETRNEWH